MINPHFEQLSQQSTNPGYKVPGCIKKMGNGHVILGTHYQKTINLSNVKIYGSTEAWPWPAEAWPNDYMANLIILIL